MTTIESIRQRFSVLSPFLNERTRRLVAAAETLGLSRGGVTLVSEATGVSRRAITVGLQELHDPDGLQADRVRQPGGGRKKKVSLDPTLKSDLEKLIGCGSFSRRPKHVQDMVLGSRGNRTACWMQEVWEHSHHTPPRAGVRGVHEDPEQHMILASAGPQQMSMLLGQGPSPKAFAGAERTRREKELHPS